jgi:hypothetical protein
MRRHFGECVHIKQLIDNDILGYFLDAADRVTQRVRNKLSITARFFDFVIPRTNS